MQMTQENDTGNDLDFRNAEGGQGGQLPLGGLLLMGMRGGKEIVELHGRHHFKTTHTES